MFFTIEKTSIALALFATFTPFATATKPSTNSAPWVEFNTTPYFKQINSPIKKITFSPSGCFFYGTTEQEQSNGTCTFFLWHILSNIPKIVIDVSPFFQSFHFSTHGKFLFVKKSLHAWSIYSLPSCNEIQSFSDCWEVTISPDEKCLYAHLSNFTYKTFDIESCWCQEKDVCNKNFFHEILTFSEKNIHIQTKIKKINDHSKIFSPNGTIRAEIHIKNQLVVYNQKTSEQIFSFDSIADNSKIAFSKQGTFLIFLTPSKHLMAWNSKTKKLSTIDKNVNDFKCSLCDSIIFVSCNTTNDNKKICIYKPEKTLFAFQSYRIETQQNNIKNFYSGQKNKTVKYSDVNILFK